MGSATQGTRPQLRDPGGRFLPSREALDRRSTAELERTLRRFGIYPDMKALEQAARDAIRQVQSAPRPDVATLLRAQAQLEAAHRRELLREAKDYVRRLEMEAHGLRGKGTQDVRAVWQAVGDERTCDSCDMRHGEEQPMRYWNMVGVPGSSNLVCGARCRCELVPLEWVSEQEAELAA